MRIEKMSIEEYEDACENPKFNEFALPFGVYPDEDLEVAMINRLECEESLRSLYNKYELMKKAAIREFEIELHEERE